MTTVIAFERYYLNMIFFSTVDFTFFSSDNNSHFLKFQTVCRNVKLNGFHPFIIWGTRKKNPPLGGHSVNLKCIFLSTSSEDQEGWAQGQRSNLEAALVRTSYLGTLLSVVYIAFCTLFLQLSTA